jgi:hypothetical protein
MSGTNRCEAFSGVFIVGSLASISLIEPGVRGSLFHAEVGASCIRHVRRALLVGLLVNLAATLLALVLPVLALTLIFGVRLGWLRLRYEVPVPASVS